MQTRFFHSALLLLAFLGASMFAQRTVAGKYNPDISIGDKAPVWKDLPGVDGKKHSLADLANKKVVVVVFTCNSCPYAVDYEDRLVAFARKHTGPKKKVALVAINVNKFEDDLLPAMKKRAQKKKFSFPYLYDATQEIAKKFGATRTPEFFVLNEKRKIVYMGAMDDDSDPAKAQQSYLEESVNAAFKGAKPKTEETVAIGCNIRFERRRRKRK